jgi:hypothetical protein
LPAKANWRFASIGIAQIHLLKLVLFFGLAEVNERSQPVQVCQGLFCRLELYLQLFGFFARQSVNVGILLTVFVASS